MIFLKDNRENRVAPESQSLINPPPPTTVLCKYRGTYVIVSITDGRVYRYITISVVVLSLRYVQFLWLSTEINGFLCVFILLGARKHHYTNSSILLTCVGSVFFPWSGETEEVCFICKVPNRVVAKAYAIVHRAVSTS